MEQAPQKQEILPRNQEETVPTCLKIEALGTAFTLLSAKGYARETFEAQPSGALYDVYIKQENM